MSLARAVRSREALMIALIVVLVAAVSARAPGFVAAANLDNVLTDASVLVMLAIAQLMVILTRGIDVSAASVLAFAGMFSALLSSRYPELPVPAYLLAAVGAGASLGAVNGALVSLARIPPIVTTIGTLAVFRGMIYLISGGEWVSAHEMSITYRAFPLERVLGVQKIIWVAAAVALVSWVYLNHTRGGRRIYAIGVNPAAARYVGIPLRWTEFKVYVLSGAIAGLAGYLWTARFAVAFTDAASGMEFTIIAACMIGGVSIAGGVGSLAGAALGALFLGLITSALTYLQVSPFYGTLIAGCIILTAVVLNSRGRRRQGLSILEHAGDAR